MPASTKLLLHIDEFAKELNCTLCNNIYKSPFTTTHCGHVYCRECIQNYLKDVNTECPQCGVQIQGKSLTRNSSYATMVQCIVKLKALVSEEDPIMPANSSNTQNDLIMSALEDFITEEIDDEKRVETDNAEIDNREKIAQVKPPLKLGILLTGLSEDQKALIQGNMQKLSKLYGNAPIKILKDFSTDHQVTHVICACAPKARCPRTLKYLLGIANKSWIISFDWILKSLEKGQVLAEEDFIVVGDEAVQCDTNACAKSRYDTGKLFDGSKFYLAGAFNAPGPTKADLTNLIQAAGGSICKRPEDDVIQISNNSTGPKPGERTYAWLFDSISFYDMKI